MSLKEIKPDGKEIIYPDGGLIGRGTLARAFVCSPFAVGRILKRGAIPMVKRQIDEQNIQPFVEVDHFPTLIKVMQRIKAKDVKKKLKSEPVDTSRDFRVISDNGTIFEYVHPDKTTNL